MIVEVCFQDDVSEVIPSSRLRSYARKVMQLKHRNLTNVFEVGVLDNGRWALVRQAGPGRWIYLAEMNHADLNFIQKCSVLYGLTDVLDYLYRKESRGGAILNWDEQIRCSFVTQNRLVFSVHPPNPSDVDLLIQGSYCAISKFTAPELIDSFTPTPAADSFALAAIAFQLFTGCQIVEQDSSQEIAHRIRSFTFPSVRQLASSLPPDLSDLIEAALRFPAAQRPTFSRWKETLAKLGAERLHQAGPEEGSLPSRETALKMRLKNVLGGTQMQFNKFAQLGDVPMTAALLTEVEDGQYTLNLPESSQTLPSYCQICGNVGKQNMRFCHVCGQPLI
ncbi:hypothetical protein L0156_27455 [bacterium]|nr:hypothetical protein [bacterium]